MPATREQVRCEYDAAMARHAAAEKAERRRLARLRRDCEGRAAALGLAVTVAGGGWKTLARADGRKVASLQGWDAVARKLGRIEAAREPAR